MTVANKTLLVQTQAKPHCMKLIRIEDVIFNNNFAWHFSSCDYSISRTSPEILPHLKKVRREGTFFSFSLITVAKRSFKNVARFLDPSLDCDEFVKSSRLVTMFPLYRIGFYNVVKTIRCNGNRIRHTTLYNTLCFH